MKQRYTIFFSALSLAISMGSYATEINGDSSGITLSDTPSNSLSVSVTGPADFSQESESYTGTFYVDSETSLVDGTYSYKIMGELEVAAATAPSDGSEGRSVGSVPTETPTGIIETGYFRLAEGELLEEVAE